MTRTERVSERVSQTARACEATETPWGLAFAQGLRVSLALAYRRPHAPATRDMLRAIQAAMAREDWQAVVALSAEHDPNPWRRKRA